MGLKIIELLVDDELTGDTKVEEIALVLQPAIDTEFVFFSKQKFQESYSDYPESVRENALRAVKYAQENGWGVCGTSVGKQRASQLSKGEPISLDTIQRMYSYLSRHKVDLIRSKTYEDGCGKLMYDAWGGEEALKWSQRKIRQVEQEMGYDLGTLSPWSQTTGNTETFEKPCWDGYIMIGWKEKDGKRVPNCVPETELKKEDMCGCGGDYVMEEQFVKPRTGESESEFISRCVPFVLNEGATQDQALGKCYGMWRNSKFSDCDGDYMLSEMEMDIFGYQTRYFYMCPGAVGTFTEILKGNNNEDTIGMVRSASVVADRVFEIEDRVIKQEHSSEQDLTEASVLVDDFKDIINEIEKVHGREYDVSYMDGHIEKISSYLGKEKMYVDDSNCGCGCWNDGTYETEPSRLYFDRITINGQPVFETEEEALLYAQELGCQGSHVHVIDGKEYYMSCYQHPEEFSVEEYTEEDYEILKLFKFLSETDYEKFEAVVGSLRGRSEQEVKDLNLKRVTPFYKYERLLEGSPDRDFCMSIENRYFRMSEIELLKNTNLEFGHEKQPYSKWLYKGGPNCVHGWRKYLVQGIDIVEDPTFDKDSKPGTPPKSMVNQGYYSEETKRRSEQAYIISQQNMSKQIKETQFKYDGEKRMIYSPAMKPGILIPRIDEVTKEKYFVTFKPETIRKMSQRYLIDKRTGDGHTNYEHTDQKLNEVYLVESWIVEGEKDKAYELGYTKDEVGKGTWMVGFRVDNPKVWDMVKQGKIKGISIEGNFEYSFGKQDYDKYLIEEINNILNQIK